MWFYPIDWVATGTWMQAWAGFAGAGAVFYAAHRGAASFEQWLRQRQTERKIVAAERIMTFAYKAKRAMQSIRNPGSFGYESDAAEAKLKETVPNFTSLDSGKRHRMVIAQIVYDRLDTAKEVWAELFECLPIARAFFGTTCERQVHAIWEARAQISTAAQMYRAHDPANGSQGRYEKAFWDILDEGEPGSVTTLINGSVTYMEANVLPFISGERPAADTPRE